MVEVIMTKDKKYDARKGILVIGLLLGLASPLPIWQGPTLYWNLTLVIISAILIIVACLGTIQKEQWRGQKDQVCPRE